MCKKGVDVIYVSLLISNTFRNVIAGHMRQDIPVNNFVKISAMVLKL